MSCRSDSVFSILTARRHCAVAIRSRPLRSADAALTRAQLDDPGYSRYAACSGTEMDLSQLLGAPALASLGFGGAAGLVVGYTAKKVTKLIALMLGLAFILVQVLAYKGLITVNWGAVQSTAEGVWTDPHGLTLADHAWEILTANLPFGGGFVAGFALGFKLG